ncbi:hypothetical protein ES703_71268 [subsurface metagenome]
MCQCKPLYAQIPRERRTVLLKQYLDIARGHAMHPWNRRNAEIDVGSSSRDVGLDGAEPGGRKTAAVGEFAAVTRGTERQRDQVVDMSDNESTFEQTRCPVRPRAI